MDSPGGDTVAAKLSNLTDKLGSRSHQVYAKPWQGQQQVLGRVGQAGDARPNRVGARGEEEVVVGRRRRCDRAHRQPPARTG